MRTYCSLLDEFEDTNEAIRIRKSKKDRQHNGQKKKYKRTNNDLQNITQKSKVRVTMNLTKIWGELRCSRRVGSSCSTSGTCHVTLITNSVMSAEWGKDRKLFKTSISSIYLTEQVHKKYYIVGKNLTFRYI